MGAGPRKAGMDSMSETVSRLGDRVICLAIAICLGKSQILTHEINKLNTYATIGVFPVAVDSR